MKATSLLKRSIRVYLLCALSLWSVSCHKDDDDTITPIQTLTYDFEQGDEGWQAGISDFPADWDQSRFEFSYTHQELPASVSEGGMAMRISGRNISDDLFMFMKKQVTGLQPNHTYRVTFEVELASMYLEQSVGIGGSPGASVYLKAGGTAAEPMPVEQNGQIRMNIDKGNQATGGNDMVELGNIGIPGEVSEYQLIARDNLQHPVEITTDSNGNLWLILGTDSGFEGVTALYYNTVKVSLMN